MKSLNHPILIRVCASLRLEICDVRLDSKSPGLLKVFKDIQVQLKILITFTSKVDRLQLGVVSNQPGSNLSFYD